MNDIFSYFGKPVFDGIQCRTRQLGAGMLSLLFHAAVLICFISLTVAKREVLLPDSENAVFLNSPIFLPFEGDDPAGGGGGGGGKNEPGAWATGRIPQASRTQMLPPDPESPKPLLDPGNLFEQPVSSQLPFDIPQDQTIAIGDIAAPNGLISSGPGSGGGIGPGQGLGIGPGDGSGVGPGSNGGIGGGPDGGTGTSFGPGSNRAGLKEPVIVSQPRPEYTDEARRARVEGSVVLNVIIRKSGRVDVLKIARGIGYGLDESAIRTVISKWVFRPATVSGVPIDLPANIVVEFHLRY